MAQVKAHQGESVEQLIRRFNKKVQGEGILTDLRKHEFYEKPSSIRKQQKYALERKLTKKRP
ncbi:MAG TPA: 30S ribosomal protein S21 [Patescibacteria group bacterium]|nr:30S ribosomal protein S21 [Patescibacteria group bacterium]